MNPQEEQDKIIAGHEYDGIEELDNPLPGWWMTTFVLTIVFSVLYLAYYEGMGGPTSDEALNSELVAIYKARQGKADQAMGPVEINWEELAQNNLVRTRGQTVYSKRCALCHLPDGGGEVGPNLCDSYWIHGKGALEDIYHVIVHGGREGKGMQAWRGTMSEADLKAVTVFVKSLGGTTPSKAKAPEGEKVALP